MADLLASNIIKLPGKAEYKTSLFYGPASASVVLGGKDETTGSKFVPNINAAKWDDECWLNINYPEAIHDEKETWVDGAVSISVGDNTHRYYIKDGRLEYEIEFAKRPPSDIVTLNLAFSEGLQFYHQPELTQEEKDEGCYRPDNVINSYAVYWKIRSLHQVSDIFEIHHRYVKRRS